MGRNSTKLARSDGSCSSFGPGAGSGSRLRSCIGHMKCFFLLLKCRRAFLNAVSLFFSRRMLLRWSLTTFFRSFSMVSTEAEEMGSGVAMKSAGAAGR